MIRSLRDLLPRALSWQISHAAWLIGEPLFLLMGRRTKDCARDASEADRILVVRPDEIGDVVLTTPFFRELRRSFPRAWITLVVKPAVHNLVELCPYVDEVQILDWNTMGHLWAVQRLRRAVTLALKHLLPHRFDFAIVPRWGTDHYLATFVAYLSGALWRVGYSENVTEHKRQFNSGFDCLYSHIIHDKAPKHEVEHNLDVISFLGGTVHDSRMDLWTSSRDDEFAEQQLRLHGVRTDDLLIGLAPGARELKRMWPISSFVELGYWLRKEYLARIVVLGGPGDEPLGRELVQQVGASVIDLVGRATLRQTGALLRYCHLCVANDTGLMHLAAAAGVPVIEISCHPLDGSPLHPNSPKRFGPWGVPNLIVQPRQALDPCSTACMADHAHCITGIAVEEVKQAIIAQLSQVGRPGIKLGQVVQHGV